MDIRVAWLHGLPIINYYICVYVVLVQLFRIFGIPDLYACMKSPFWPLTN